MTAARQRGSLGVLASVFSLTLQFRQRRIRDGSRVRLIYLLKRRNALGRIFTRQVEVRLRDHENLSAPWLGQRIGQPATCQQQAYPASRSVRSESQSQRQLERAISGHVLFARSLSLVISPPSQFLSGPPAGLGANLRIPKVGAPDRHPLEAARLPQLLVTRVSRYGWRQVMAGGTAPHIAARSPKLQSVGFRQEWRTVSGMAVPREVPISRPPQGLGVFAAEPSPKQARRLPAMKVPRWLYLQQEEQPVAVKGQHRPRNFASTAPFETFNGARWSADRVPARSGNAYAHRTSSGLVKKRTTRLQRGSDSPEPPGIPGLRMNQRSRIAGIVGPYFDAFRPPLLARGRSTYNSSSPVQSFLRGPGSMRKLPSPFSHRGPRSPHDDLRSATAQPVIAHSFQLTRFNSAPTRLFQPAAPSAQTPLSSVTRHEARIARGVSKSGSALAQPVTSRLRDAGGRELTMDLAQKPTITPTMALGRGGRPVKLRGMPRRGLSSGHMATAEMATTRPAGSMEVRPIIGTKQIPMAALTSGSFNMLPGWQSLKSRSLRGAVPTWARKAGRVSGAAQPQLYLGSPGWPANSLRPGAATGKQIATGALRERLHKMAAASGSTPSGIPEPTMAVPRLVARRADPRTTATDLSPTQLVHVQRRAVNPERRNSSQSGQALGTGMPEPTETSARFGSHWKNSGALDPGGPRIVAPPQLQAISQQVYELIVNRVRKEKERNGR